MHLGRVCLVFSLQEPKYREEGQGEGEEGRTTGHQLGSGGVGSTASPIVFQETMDESDLEHYAFLGRVSHPL